MNHDTVFSPPKASGGVHEEIESFLQTLMQGLMRPHDQEAAAEQSGKPGRPVSLPSVTLWMAVLIAVLRGLGSQRAHLAVVGGWWLVEAAKLRYWRSSGLQASGAGGVATVSSAL